MPRTAAFRAQLDDVGCVDHAPALQRTAERLLFACLYHTDDPLKTVDDAGEIATALAKVAEFAILAAEDGIDTSQVDRRKRRR